METHNPLKMCCKQLQEFLKWHHQFALSVSDITDYFENDTKILKQHKLFKSRALVFVTLNDLLLSKAALYNRNV